MTSLKILTLAMVGASLVACGNKSDSNTNRGGGIPGIGIGACSSCTGWGGQGELFLGSGYSSASFPMAMSIELLGDSNQVNYLNSRQMDPSKTYSGQTFLKQAVINVSSNISSGQCMIPAGTYTLTATANMGNYSGGSFVIPQFEMTNGTYHFLMSLQRGAIVAPYVGGPAPGFGALLLVTAGPGRYVNQMVNCNDQVGFQFAP